ncbi:MAG: hypothetical protein M3O01_03845 [Pseudomonadota bacterium]|nr:hypothetical protein [Pseudomonadota bacterium]
MSDPQPTKLRKRPARAEPLQPDRPGSGDDSETATPDEPSGGAEQRAAADAKKQADAALKNVSEGYD